MEVMIDIETLDTRPSAVVLSVGLLAFDGFGARSGLTLYPSYSEQVEAGRTASLDTLQFWVGVGGAAAESTFVSESKRSSLQRTGLDLQCWFGDAGLMDPDGRGLSHAAVWANGDKFDLGILEDLLPCVPWAYNSPRDLRTVISEAKLLGWTRSPSRPDAVAHDALSDCRTQVDALLDVRGFYASLVGKRPWP
jgi:hypothetical protein